MTDNRRCAMRWIHISDIHYNPKADGSYTMKARDNLPIFLSRQKIKADHLFVTGDFRHAYKQRNQDEDVVAEDAVNYIISIADAADIPRENIHLIPGNHDLKRFDKKNEKKKCRKLESIRQKYLKENDLFQDEDLTFLNGPFSFYISVCTKLKDKIPQINIPWLDKKEIPSASEEIYDDFSLLCINTCLFCHGDDARKNLVIDTGNVYRKIDSLVKKNPGKPVIVLAHHGLAELESNVEKELEDILKDINEPTLYLCGDAHDLWIRSINKTLEVTTGCLLEAKSVKTLISFGECSNTSFQFIRGFKCERGRWAFYPHFDEEVKKYLDGDTKSISLPPNKAINNQGKGLTTTINNKTNPHEDNVSAKNEKTLEILAELGKNQEAYYDACTHSYGLIITDISGVLFDSNKQGTEEFPEKIVEIMSKLAKRHISICFTTGRGRTGARQLLLNLAQKIIEMDNSLTWESLSSEWACITHNGVYLLTTPDKSRSGFLANAEYLCPDVHEYIDVINQTTILSRFREIINRVCKRERIDDKGIVSDVSLEPVSIRFSLENCSDKIFLMIVEELRKYCKNTFSHVEGRTWNASIGSYEQKKMFEYSLVNKSDAVKEYISRYRPIEASDIIRIACGGQHGDSDFSFLSDGPSFSVGDKDTTSANTCFPVIKEDSQIVTGTEATEYLLSTLRFYPSLCVKTVPDINYYKTSFANAISGARKRSEEIFGFYNTRLAWMDFLYEENYGKDNTSRIFDIKSGAITFSDLEWVKIELSFQTELGDAAFYEQIRCFSNIISKKLDNVDDRNNKPNLLYFLHTDTHVLFRGFLYYSFFIDTINSQKDTDSITVDKWVDSYKKWYSLAHGFVKEFHTSIKKLVATTSMPVRYITRKLILGGLDNLRNILLILDTFYLHQYTMSKKQEEKDVIIDLENASNPCLIQCQRISMLLSNCLSFMYTGVFESQIDTGYIKTVNVWLQQLLLFMNEREHDYDYLSDKRIVSPLGLYPSYYDNKNIVNPFFTEAFPRWRESDCFIENTAAIEIFLSKVSENVKNLVFWGIPYGSLEHPILASVLCNKHGITVERAPCYIMLHGKYENRHESEYKLSVIDSVLDQFIFAKDCLNVLIDDTLTTATTLDLAVKCLSHYDIYINNIVVMRYAGLNRLNHYLTNRINPTGNALNASAPDVTKFFNMISGLVAEAPYSKLHKYRPEDVKPYEDLLGIFDKSKNRIRNYLKINY